MPHSIMREIAHFEVALRNAYDRVMLEHWEGDWLLDDSSPARMPLIRQSERGELGANYTNQRIIRSLAPLHSLRRHEVTARPVSQSG